MSVFISTACARHPRIGESVRMLAEAGYRHIELTGGSEPYGEMERDLGALKDEYGLSYIVHNYFPPPDEHFMLNLASMDDDHWQLCVDHCRRALTLAQKLGGDRYGVHAGFLLDLKVTEGGRRVERRPMSDRAAALERFSKAHGLLSGEFPDVTLYVENNVLSYDNHQTFGADPFLMTSYEGYLELKEACGSLNLLLDMAHLKVSCHSLGLAFASEAGRLLELTNYLHVSENEGLADSNHGLLSLDTSVPQALRGKVDDKVITCEVYSGLEDVARTVDTLRQLENGKA